MKKKLLIAGGSHSDIPMILAAKKLGYHVITSGNRPEDLGHKHSDQYSPADFSDREAILRLAREQQVSAICSCCNDFSALSCAYAAQELKLKGHDLYQTSLILHHKDKYRAFAKQHGIPTPQAMSFSSSVDAINSSELFLWPAIVKPVDLTGGKGISLVQSPNQLSSALDRAFAISRQGRVVVEEFIAGSRHGITMLLVRGKVVFWLADDEYYYKNQYLVSGASTPTSVPQSAIEDLIMQSEKISSILALSDGIFHVQFIYYKNCTYIIEICRRPPGDLYVNLVTHATGLDYPTCIVKLAAGEDGSFVSQKQTNGYFLRHCIMGDKNGVVKDIEYSHLIKDKIIDRMLWWQPGDKVLDLLTHKHGIVFLKFSSRQEMEEYSAEMQSLVKVVVED